MTNDYHRSVNEKPESFLIRVFLLWLALVAVASAFVESGGVDLRVIAAFAALCVLPVLSTLIVVWAGRDWPRGRRALFVCLPWILMSAFFVALSGGLSSPALVFAAFPSLFALAFGWRKLAVETAVFSLLATLGAIALSMTLTGMPGLDQAARASEMFAFAGLCILPFIVGGLVASRKAEETAALQVPAGDDGRFDGAYTANLEPIGEQPSGVLIVDVTREGRIRSASGKALHGLDFRPGRIFLDAFPAANREHISVRFNSGGTFVEHIGAGDALEFTIDRHDLGTRVFIDEAAGTQPGAATPEPSSPSASSGDDSREAEALRDEIKDRMAFFAGLGHDLKTPLNAILGFSDLMRAELRGPIPEAYKDYTHLIHESGQDLLLIVEDILDYAKAEAGHARLEIEPVDLVASGESVAAQLSGQAARADVELKLLGTGEVWASADPRAVRQIWQNLISNAIKYSEAGSVVTLDARAGRGAVALSVRDTGAGMDEDDLERVAKPFQQGRNARGRAGTGLGLAVVQSFAGQLGGKVVIDTAPGEGTRVRVILPKAPPEQTAGLENAAE
ncbi:MAG: ATP-binding protein [Henriciella sp.]|uniref:ATP-binding protein n=1 Tax=Henriciella sp. TaxID=1968823 RepID=UPI003C708029